MSDTIWSGFLRGTTNAVAIGPEADDAPRGLIFPGAFFPLHAGHREMARVARAMTGRRLALELSLENVDKGSLTDTDVAARLTRLADWTVWLTRAATFARKGALFPGATFVVGIDTAVRIGAPRYYAQGAAGMQTALAALQAGGNRLLVFGRRLEDRFVTLSDVELPAALARLCDEVPPDAFRHDISSTELRGDG